MKLMLLIHVICALASLIISGLAVIKPSEKSLKTSYALVVATVATGTALIVISNVKLLSVCLSGITYLAAAAALIAAAKHRLARQSTEN